MYMHHDKQQVPQG